MLLAGILIAVAAAGLAFYFFFWEKQSAGPASPDKRSIEQILEEDLTANVTSTPSVAPEIMKSLTAPTPAKPTKGVAAPAQTAVPSDILNSLTAPSK